MISKQDIENAHVAIRDHVVNTPVVFSYTLSDLCGCQTLFKLENFQMTGAFKERGALNKLLNLTPQERDSGVVTASAGNHAQGVAYHCQRLGISAKIVMPVGTPLIKVVSTQNYGAEAVLFGQTYDQAYELAVKLSRQEGLTMVHPFDDPLVIAGQGTMAIEFLGHELCEQLDAVVCPIGGGGLISGIATYVKETRPDVAVIGVEAQACPAMKEALEKGRPVELKSASTLADGIAVKKVGEITHEIAQKYVDDVVTVGEDEIANAVLLLLEIEKIMVEGAGAVPLAALLNRRANLEGKRVLSVVSGGNMDVNILSKIITRGLLVDGRIFMPTVRLADRPGTLTEVLEVIKKLRANVIDVSHQRMDSSAPFGYVDVAITLETRGHEHVREIELALKERGYLLTGRP